jgi:hypothetical protein
VEGGEEGGEGFLQGAIKVVEEYGGVQQGEGGLHIVHHLVNKQEARMGGAWGRGDVEVACPVHCGCVTPPCRLFAVGAECKEV